MVKSFHGFQVFVKNKFIKNFNFYKIITYAKNTTVKLTKKYRGAAKNDSSSIRKIISNLVNN